MTDSGVEGCLNPERFLPQSNHFAEVSNVTAGLSVETKVTVCNLFPFLETS